MVTEWDQGETRDEIAKGHAGTFVGGKQFCYSDYDDGFKELYMQWKHMKLYTHTQSQHCA